ncbi:hypothetical protein Ancab_028441 [Ancistrocladus abbreviatus]
MQICAPSRENQPTKRQTKDQKTTNKQTTRHQPFKPKKTAYPQQRRTSPSKGKSFEAVKCNTTRPVHSKRSQPDKLQAPSNQQETTTAPKKTTPSSTTPAAPQKKSRQTTQQKRPCTIIHRRNTAQTEAKSQRESARHQHKTKSLRTQPKKSPKQQRLC